MTQRSLPKGSKMNLRIFIVFAFMAVILVAAIAPAIGIKLSLALVAFAYCATFAIVAAIGWAVDADLP